MLASFKAMSAAEQTALYVYKRVLERYPQNGKLLKVWGRFQEWVLHDPARAARSYAEAVKRGLGDNLLNLTSEESEGGDGGGSSLTAKVDEKLDGVVIIDAGGSILLANKLVYRMFGYTRGEMEGKNVAILMPQPFASRHDTYLSNYLTTGVAKILNSVRHVVALRKDRSIFPLSLTVTRLSGTGHESIFMGVMRMAEEEDPSIVRVWATPAGLILCSDSKLNDWFGVSPAELVGRPFSSLAQHPEEVEAFITHALTPAGRASVAAGKARLSTSIRHKYLQAMDVELAMAFGGTDEECILMLRIRCLTDALRLMVVDDRQRILYASGTLAGLLGTSVAALTEMSLPSLLPPPTAQLHKRWMQDMGSTRPWPGSCRAGGVVQMQALSGARIPVRLAIKSVEDTSSERGGRKHIVEVVKAAPEELLDGQRLCLTVDARGTVLAAGASPKAIFGFEPRAELIGRPLASFVDLFEEFRVDQAQLRASKAGAGGGGGGDRYSQLALQVGPQPDAAAAGGGGQQDDSVLLMVLAQAAQEGSDAHFRVGVRPCPLADEAIGRSHAQAAAAAASSATAGSALLAALGGRGSGNKLRAAIMRVDVMETDWSQDGASVGGIRFQVQLWSADCVTGVLEIDTQLKVVKADAAAGLMLGCSSQALQRTMLKSLVRLPHHVKSAGDLLTSFGAASGHGKASALKSAKAKAAQEAKVGPVLELDAAHADGQPLKLQLQAVAREGQASSRLQLRIKLGHPRSTGSLEALLQLSGALTHFSTAGVGGAGVRLASMGGKSLSELAVRSSKFGSKPGGKPSAAALGGSDSGSGSQLSGGQEQRRGEAAAAAPPAVRASAAGARSGRQLPPPGPGSDDDGAGDGGRAGRGGGARFGSQPGRASGPGARSGRAGAAAAAAAAGDSEEEEPQYQRGRGGGRGSQDDFEGRGSDGGGDDRDGPYADDPPPPRGNGAGPAWAPLDGPAPPNTRFEGGGEAAAGRRGGGGGGDDGSDAGSDEEGSKMDVSASEAGDGDDEDMTCDWRRAKRLRRILRQLDSPVARGPLLRFWRGTWALVLLLGVAHIVCYAVLATTVTQRHTDVYGVQQMAYAVDKSQMILLRANMISKCGFTRFEALDVCAQSQRDFYLAKSFVNVAQLNHYHHGVFLGFEEGSVKPMSDPDLLAYWILPGQDEVFFADTDPPGNITGESVAQTSLWSLGNRYVQAAREVNYAAKASELSGEALEALRFWRYIMRNGKDSLFHAYGTSLDLYVQFCWDRLGGLSDMLTGLLVAELIAVALCLMAFQMDLIRRVSAQRMACFSVFLALPSATLRTMATAPCQVDDDDDADSQADDDLADLAAVAGGGEETTTQAAEEPAKASKSVRLALKADESHEGGKAAKGGKLLAQARKAGGALGKQQARGVTGWLVTKARGVRRFARGIMNRTIKVNGKKLQPARGAFARFMLPLLCWWVASLAIYGVSFKSVDLLQAPLTSLQAAAHVQFMIARTRLLANMLGFLPYSIETPERADLREGLRQELGQVASKYQVMLYGGLLDTMVDDAPPAVCSASLFSDERIAHMFFSTRECLRVDQSTCFPPDSRWYEVSHSGIDALMLRFIGDMQQFLELPPAMQNANASSYEFTWRVAANDLYDGLQTASDVFVGTTLSALDELQQLHTYLLIASLLLFAAVLLGLLLPFKRRLVMESVRLAGLLSQLPQESDVEGQVKALVLDAAVGRKHGDANSAKNWSLARGVTSAAAAARAAAARASSAVTNMKARMAEASAAGAPADGGWQQQQGGGGWQQAQYGDAASDDGGSSAPDWE